MKWRKFEMPKKLDFEKESYSDMYTKFIAEPFERGYAMTVGNSLRRVLLSSIPGAAITSIKVNGVPHEFATIPGVVEDMTEIVLNLKETKIKLHTDVPKKIYLNASGEKEVKAKDITPDNDMEIVNPEHHIATLSSKNAKLEVEMEVEIGRGYYSAEKNRKEEQIEGVIPIDSIFTPVTKVKFETENTRVGQMTDFEKLILEIWTDGRIKPDEALGYATQILKDHLTVFIGFEEEAIIEEEKVDEETEHLVELLSKNVGELELSVRAANCLKVASIQTIGELVQKSEQDMLKYRNFGRKSLNEIKDILTTMKLALGMKFEQKVFDKLQQKLTKQAK